MPQPVKNLSTPPTPTSIKEAPKPLKPYLFHGVDLQYSINDTEATAECPFCTREHKFYVNLQTGQWTCKVCGGGQEKGGGGVYTFLDQLLKVSEEGTTSRDYKTLAADRGLDYPETLIHWQVCRSAITGHWLVPGWAEEKKGKLRLQQLYRYTSLDGRMMLMPTPLEKRGSKHTLFGLNLYEPGKMDCEVCEGPWDSMRLWEVLKGHKLDDDGNLVQTANLESSMLADVNVLAVPGCMVFSTEWKGWFKDKRTTFLYDNDHPKVQANGVVVPPSGTAGMKRASGLVCDVTAGLHYLHWGEEGYDGELESGTDLRDLLSKDPKKGLAELSERLRPIPEDWEVAVEDSSDRLSCRGCASWQQVINSWRKALKWTDGLDHALAVMLGSVASTGSIGDQLWVKVIGPASCGKSTLCEALSVNKTFVLSKSTIRGFHSGFRTEGEDSDEDNSLLVKLNGMTLVTKDGDTLLQSPNLNQILSEARDIYDGVSRTHYRNKMSKDYEGQRMTWLLCGTSSLRSIDSSELGERFLDCVIMERIDEALEDDILWRVANKAVEHVNIESNCEAGSHHSPELTDAMELTGGYINHLRNNAAGELPKIGFSKYAMQQCIYYGKFVAFMRARPSKHQKELGERELAARLVSQHIRLAKCLALVLNQPEVNEEVLRRTRRVCLDTSRGIVLTVADVLYPKGTIGLELKAIMMHVNCGDGDLRHLLRFLREIGVVQLVAKGNKKLWRLSDGVRGLYKDVVLEGGLK